MKIGDGTYRGDMVPLPVEVLNVITAYVLSSYSRESQRSLWACCLVSQAWYAASIHRLYFRPHLSPRNFELFARSVCPPFKARNARVRVEDMIRHLDMREIAYESSNSLTSRILSRTKASLESFLPPAVTFSITSLAPLSKCSKLILLDMSGDHYSFTLPQLLDSISNLESLVYLELPQSILRDDEMNWNGNLSWPKNLERLSAPGQVCRSPMHWDALFRSWPATLEKVSVPDCDSTFDAVSYCLNKAEFVQRLDIGPVTRHTAAPARATLFDILRIFPNLKTITINEHIALITLKRDFSLAGFRVAYENFCLERMIIRMTAIPRWATPPTDGIHTDVHLAYLKEFLEIPRLRRLEVHGPFVTIDTESHEERLKQISKMFEERATPDQRASSGIFLFPNPWGP